MALVGKFAPEAVIVLLLIVSLMLPVVVPVEKKMVPNVALVPAPLIVQFWTVSVDASAMN